MPEEDISGQGQQEVLALRGVRQKLGLLGSPLAADQQIHVLLCHIIMQQLRQLQNLEGALSPVSRFIPAFVHSLAQSLVHVFPRGIIEQLMLLQMQSRMHVSLHIFMHLFIHSLNHVSSKDQVHTVLGSSLCEILFGQ